MNFLKSVCSKINQQKKPIGNVFRNGFSIYEKSLVNSNGLQKTGLLGNLLTYQKSLYANGLQRNRARFLRNFSTGLMLNTAHLPATFPYRTYQTRQLFDGIIGGPTPEYVQAKDPYVYAKNLVIWDTDNCGIPKILKPSEIAPNIRKALVSANFLGPVSIEAVGKPLKDFITQELRSTGIRVTPVYSDKLNASDIRIVARMCMWVLDNIDPANILLVSGDGDYCDVMDHLRVRGHNLMIAQILKSSNLNLKVTSKFVWEWISLASGGGQLSEEEKIQIREKYCSKYLSTKPKSEIAEAPLIRCERCFDLLQVPKRDQKLTCRCSYLIDLTSAKLLPQTLNDPSLSPASKWENIKT